MYEFRTLNWSITWLGLVRISFRVRVRARVRVRVSAMVRFSVIVSVNKRWSLHCDPVDSLLPCLPVCFAMTHVSGFWIKPITVCYCHSWLRQFLLSSGSATMELPHAGFDFR